MKVLSLKSSIVVILFTLTACYNTSAQNITGIWRGYFITDSYDQYKFELQIKQSGNTVSGVSYSYLSTVFYGKATLTGSFNKSAKKALIQEIKTVELRMSGGSQACIMKCIFEYSKSGREEFLEGTYSSKYEKDGLLTKKGGDCGGGKVYLRRVTTSDFYIEPFLRGKIKSSPVIVNQAPVKKELPKKTAQPTTTTKVPDKKPVVVNKTPIKKDTIVTKPPTATVKIDSIKKVSIPIETPPPSVLKNRTNELVKVLTVNNPNVTVKFYDNGEIDGDSISVYLDNRLMLSNKGLTANPLSLNFKIDEDGSDHELTMVAENLGRIPPNTSLMIVEAGDQRFEVRITSTEQKNAVVKFRYRKSN